MSLHAVIFDLDGTLLDTLQDLADSMNQVLRAEGFPAHPPEAYRYFVGSGAAALVRRALPGTGQDEAALRRYLNAFLLEYEKRWNVKTAPYDGIGEMLDSLKAQGIPIAVLSNKPHAFTCRCVEELLPSWRFDAVLGQREGVPRKPDPAGVVEAARMLNVPPSEILYLGDSDIDMKTAVASGAFPVGALWGFRPAAELEQSGARRLIVHPSELLPLIGP